MKKNSWVLFALLFLFQSPLWADSNELYLQLSGQNQSQPLLNLALPPFLSRPMGQKKAALMAHSLRDVVRADFLMSRYFNVIENGPAFNGSNAREISSDWRKKGASFLLTADVSTALDQLQVTVHLLDLNSRSTILGHFYKGNADSWREMAHQMSDEIVEALTGKPGIAHTHIAFSNDQTTHKEIYLVDYDGQNLRRLTWDHSIDILPRFTPDGKQIVYTSYKNGNPDLFILDLKPGSRPRSFSSYQGLNIAGGFSPNGDKLLMTLSRGKNPNVYIKNLVNGHLTQLTNDRGADSSPTLLLFGATILSRILVGVIQDLKIAHKTMPFYSYFGIPLFDFIATGIWLSGFRRNINWRNKSYRLSRGCKAEVRNADILSN